MSKEKLLSIKLNSEEIEIDGEKYEIREMMGSDAAEYEGSLFSIVNGKPAYNTKNAKAKLIALTLYQNNAPVFEAKDIALINQLPASVTNRIFAAAARINKLDADTNVKN